MTSIVVPTALRGSALDGFRLIAEALPCIAWTAGTDGMIDWYNRDFQKYTGLSLPQAIRRGWIASAHRDEQAAIAEKWACAIRNGTLLDCAVRLRNVEGSYRWFIAQARPFYGNDAKINGWLGTLSDTHDRQTAVDANTHVVNALMEGYLSKQFPIVKGLKFDTLYRPANALEKVGGDWFDVFELPDGRFAFSLGDVCGHGVDAAVKMGEAKQAIFVAASLGDSAPENVLKHANDVIFLNNHHVSITTAVYGIVDTARRTGTYASAGHHPPILAHASGEVVVLPNHGFPLGVEEQMPPRIKTHGFSYENGSMLVLYTDGLIEFDHNVSDGEALLLAASAESIRSKAKFPAKFITDRVLGSAVPADDVAVLTISFHDE